MADVQKRAVRLVREHMVSPRTSHETTLQNEERFRAQVGRELMSLRRAVQGLEARIEALEKSP